MEIFDSVRLDYIREFTTLNTYLAPFTILFLFVEIFSTAEHLVDDRREISCATDGRSSVAILKHDSITVRKPGDTLQFTSNCKYSADWILSSVSLKLGLLRGNR